MRDFTIFVLGITIGALGAYGRIKTKQLEMDKEILKRQLEKVNEHKES